MTGRDVSNRVSGSGDYFTGSKGGDITHVGGGGSGEGGVR